MGGELGEVDGRAPGEGMTVTGEEQEILGEQRFDGELGRVDGQVHDGGVVLRREHRRDEHRGAALGDDDAELRVAHRHLGEEAGEQPARRRAEHAETDVADDVAVALGHLGGDVVDLAQDAPRPLDDAGSVVGQSAVGAVDEHRVELLLEAGHVARHVGLHREQRPGGGRERAVVGDRHEGGELAHVHGRTLASHSAGISSSDRGNRFVLLARSRACAYTHKYIVEAIHPPCTAR